VGIHKGAVDMDRFWSKVAKGADDACWLWQAGRFKSGYGAFAMRPHTKRAHRVAWELVNGPIPDGLHVLHECDTPPCCNPAHLFLGTHADNMRDRQSKGGYPTKPVPDRREYKREWMRNYRAKQRAGKDSDGCRM
jgi:hypothetical protein